jgi:hypothetical protein
MRLRARKWAALTAAAALAAGLLATGCERIAPIRTLPTWVRGIYIPMFQNRSYEPAIEEQGTLFTQEAFLTEGQLDVVQKQDADATLLVSIEEWRASAGGRTGEKVTDSREYFVRASVKLVEPYDESALIADLGEVRIFGGGRTDPRSVRFEPEPDRKDGVMRALAGQIVSRTLNGFPTNVGAAGQAVDIPAISAEEVLNEDVLKPRLGTAY